MVFVLSISIRKLKREKERKKNEVSKEDDGVAKEN